MDVFSEILASTRVSSAVVGRATLTAPWGFAADPINSPTIHVIQEGSCYLALSVGGQQIALGRGDLVLVASGNGHIISNPRNAPVSIFSSTNVLAADARRGTKNHDCTTLLCAKYTIDEVGLHPLMSFLPAVVHLTRGQIESDESLRLAVDLLSIESASHNVGYDLVASRILDSVFVLLLRAWIKLQPSDAGAWFGALRDKGIARALRLIHERPADAWTVASLAAGALQSRATFARHFTQRVGEPPLSYLGRWRMNLAAKALRNTTDTIEQISLAVGYQSVPSFTQAFTKSVGQSPNAYRRNCLSEHEASRAPNREASCPLPDGELDV
jgi:AraC-like DNA-binding protein